MATQAKQILTPVGRFVSGALYNPRTKDMDDKPLTNKDGSPRVEYVVGIAIQKQGEQHWASTPWGSIIWAAGHEGWPNGQAQSPSFAWKISDGDSMIPNKNNKRNADKEGWRGCWVLFFTSGTQPKICNADGSQLLMEPNAVKPGYYIQLAGTVKDNNPAQSPGVYLNLNAVALAGYGPEIVTGIDVGSVGFGGQALPPGASATPVAAMVPHAPAAPAAAAMPPVPGAPAGYPVPGAPMPPAAAQYAPPAAPVQQYAPPAAPVQQYAPPPAAPVAAVPVMPNPGFVQAVGAAMPAGVPGVPAAPQYAVAQPAPVAPVRQLTAAAQGASYEQLIANGWTDATLIQHGMMLP